MFHVELAPLGGILGPLKSDLGVFWAKIPLYPYNVKFSNSIFSKSANLPILSFWILNLHIIICQFQKRSTVKHFFSLTPCSCHLCNIHGLFEKFKLKTLTSVNLSNFALCHPLPSTLAAKYSPGCFSRLKLNVVELDPRMMITNLQITGRFQ